MTTQTNARRFAAKHGMQMVLAACVAAAISACADTGSGVHPGAAYQLSSSAPTRAHILPNGLVAEPYAD